jgi:Tfp pilus assembly protein PilO
MNMRNGKDILAWAPPVLSVFAVLGAIGFAIARQTRSAQGVEQVRRLGANLSEIASRAVGGVLSPQQAEAIETRREDLDQRLTDSAKPAVLQAELVEAASKSGLVVREVQPMASNAGHGTTGKDKNGELTYPSYRINVDGDYQQMAAYMENCKHLRIPARVISLHMATLSLLFPAGSVLQGVIADHIGLRATTTSAAAVPASLSRSNAR